MHLAAAFFVTSVLKVLLLAVKPALTVRLAEFSPIRFCKWLIVLDAVSAFGLVDIGGLRKATSSLIWTVMCQGITLVFSKSITSFAIGDQAKSTLCYLQGPTVYRTIPPTLTCCIQQRFLSNATLEVVSSLV